MREIEMMNGFSIGRRNINNIRNADDTVLVVHSVNKLQANLSALIVAGEEKVQIISEEITECMVV